MMEPREIEDEGHERVLERVAAIDVAKASGMVCVRVPHGSKPGRRAAGWEVPATTRGVIELGDHLGGAAAWRMRVSLDLAGEQFGEERWEVDGQAGLPGQAAVRVILGQEPVKPAVELAELSLDVDLAGVEVVAFKADRLTPSQAGGADGEDHGEVPGPAGGQRGSFGQ